MKQPLSFSKLKLTNNTADQNGHVRIEKMSKIFNRIVVIFFSDRFEFDAQIYSTSSRYSSGSIINKRFENFDERV